MKGEDDRFVRNGKHDRLYHRRPRSVNLPRSRRTDVPRLSSNTSAENCHSLGSGGKSPSGERTTLRPVCKAIAESALPRFGCRRSTGRGEGLDRNGRGYGSSPPALQNKPKIMI